MMILAIDSSGMTASAALLTEEKVLCEMSVNNKKTHSQTLLPMIEAVMENAGQQYEALDAIALAEGPGSFTGLRIGAALAKGLGLAADKPLIGVSTIDALAYEAGPSEALICPMIDARHETVYTGLYWWSADGLETVQETTVLSVSELAEQICTVLCQRSNQQDEIHSAQAILITGDGADAYAKELKSCLADLAAGAQPDAKAITVHKAPVHHSRQRAAAVGALALKLAGQGQVISSDDFKPRYYRMTQAERERMKRKQA